MLYDGSTYQRQSHKVAPHNSYTSLDALDERADQLGYSDTNHFNGFTFYEDTNDWWYSSNDRLLTYGNVYGATYHYDETLKTYARTNYNVEHIDDCDSVVSF